MTNIAIVGCGIAGLSALYYLDEAGFNAPGNRITLFEQNNYIGGHANTIEVEGIPVDTGFIVYNPNNYPELIQLFDKLRVDTIQSDMSFAASIDGFEYGSRNLKEIFGQRSNIFNPSFYKMLFDILRFYKDAPNILDAPTNETLGTYLSINNYSDIFINKHIVPMGAAIWSTPSAQMLNFPVKSFIQFFKNHELLKTKERPVWRTVKGGSREYVKKILEQCCQTEIMKNTAVQQIERIDGKVLVKWQAESRLFDHVILATHSDQSLKMLKNPTESEKEILGSFRYQINHAYVHRDARLMPQTKKVWSSWNYISNKNSTLSLTYWMNCLQQIPGEDLFVTLNPPFEPQKTIKKITYEHPVYDRHAIDAWERIHELQGNGNLYFAGAWQGFGFHEDGVVAGKKAAQEIIAA